MQTYTLALRPAHAHADQHRDRTNTPTITPTPVIPNTYTPTTTATPTACPLGLTYNITTAVGTIVPAVTDTGNHCDDCTTLVTLPFPVNLYNQTYTTAYVSSNGQLDFVTPDAAFTNSCLPDAATSVAIFPYWDDQRTDVGTGVGIFTLQVGTTFYIEWRTTLFTGGTPEDYEVILTQGSPNFSIVYWPAITDSASETIGVQQSATVFTQYNCNGVGGTIIPNRQLNFTLACVQPSPTPTNTATATNTPTATATNTPGGPPSPPRLRPRPPARCRKLGPWAIVAPYPAGTLESAAASSDGTYFYLTGGFVNLAASTLSYRYDPSPTPGPAWPPCPAQPTMAAPPTPPIPTPSTSSAATTAPATPPTSTTSAPTPGPPAPRCPPPASGPKRPTTPRQRQIYVIGGLDTGFVEQSQTWEYDPVANSWNTTRANAPVGEGSSTAPPIIRPVLST